MGIFDSFKNKADDLRDKAKEHAGDLTGKAEDQAGDMPGQAGDMASSAQEHVSDGLGQAGDMANDQTGGRFGSQIDQGVDIAKQRMGDADEAARAEAEQQG
jgi:uncharacterized protein YjbJ (UPF0337 family)